MRRSRGRPAGCCSSRLGQTHNNQVTANDCEKRGPWLPIAAVATALMCASPGGVAQSSGASTAAQKAGEYAAFRQLLIPRRDACYIDQDDYREQDSAAERLFFGLYNPNYGGRGTPKTAAFLEQATQTQHAVVGNPAAYDLVSICNEVLNEIRAFHPHSTAASVATPEASAAACATWSKALCQIPNLTPPGCSVQGRPAPLNWTPQKGVWSGRELHLRHVDVYTDYCYGKTTDGILFLPKTVGSAAPPPPTAGNGQCAAGDAHLWQFVNSGPAAPPAPGLSYPSGSCPGISRNYGQWYVDACPGNKDNPAGYLVPELRTSEGGVNRVLMADQPTAYTDAGTPAKKQFYDALMCGTTLVTATFTWSMQGQSSPANGSAHPYTALSEAPLWDPDLKWAVCSAIRNVNPGDFKDLEELTAIAQTLGCPKPPSND
jgi:hypothetical protein